MTPRASEITLARICLRACMVLAACVLAASAAAQLPVRSIDVTYDGETYVANARMFAPVAQTVAWEVLTDFPNMSKFVPNVGESHVVKQGDMQMTIEQKGVAEFHGLSVPYTTLREIVLDPQKTILSTQVKGSMKRLQSLMTVSAEADGTRLQYRLELVPSFVASKTLSKDFLKHEIEEQFTAIIGEMVKRKK